MRYKKAILPKTSLPSIRSVNSHSKIKGMMQVTSRDGFSIQQSNLTQAAHLPIYDLGSTPSL